MCVQERETDRQTVCVKVCGGAMEVRLGSVEEKQVSKETLLVQQGEQN